MTQELKPCPFCGSVDIYETYQQEYAYGTKNPEIFCNSCKAIFAVEDDSPYMNCEEDYAYRKKKTAEAWNQRGNTQPEQSELIRCKDCRNWDCGENEVDKWSWCPILHHDMDATDFCSYAERKEE